MERGDNLHGDALIGQQLDSFLVQQPLGRGGMARVYKGLDTRLKRPVAIKVIDEGLRASDTYAQRFEREAQAVASLKHPNIVTVFHFGQREHLYYLVMEYIDGTDLDSIIQRYESAKELMPHADVIRVMDAIGGALDYAHSQGVIHRDVKPSNIMLERDGRPVLTDFGLALRVSEGSIGDTFGSPHYISPEQARSSANAVPQSDLYSLGVVAYELLTGALPFDDPAPTALAMQHIMAAVPSPLTFNRNLSPAVETVLFKILAKDPAARYQTAAEFVTALRGTLEALRVNPVKIATADLPPGAASVSPRRLSMQTALDKVNQEMAFTQARGQALTQSPVIGGTDSAASNAAPVLSGRRNHWLPYAIAGGGALIALFAIGLLANGVLSHQASANATSTRVVTSIPASSTNIPTALALAPTQPTLPPPTNTLIPPSPTATIPTNTATPLSPTAVPPTVVTAAAVIADTALPTLAPPTLSPPTNTPIPTGPATLLPLTNTPIPTTVIPTVPTTANVSPTVAFPNGRPILLSWDGVSVRLKNQGGQILYVSSLAFEQLDSSGQPTLQFQGGRWARYFPSLYPGACMILETKQDVAAYTHADCPSGVNARIASVSGESFWLAQNGAVEFRVLWGKLEVGRCTIAAPPCTIYLPPS
ncbi:MAG: serine/threonine-protein kinase [Aggregatilineales bacterium]